MRNQFVSAALLSVVALGPLVNGRAIEKRDLVWGPNSEVVSWDYATTATKTRTGSKSHSTHAKTSSSSSSSSSSVPTTSIAPPYYPAATSLTVSNGGYPDPSIGGSTITFSPPRKRSPQDDNTDEIDNNDDSNDNDDVGSIVTGVDNPGPATEQTQGGSAGIAGLESGTSFDPAFDSTPPVIINERSDAHWYPPPSPSGSIANSQSGVATSKQQGSHEIAVPSSDSSLTFEGADGSVLSAREDEKTPKPTFGATINGGSVAGQLSGVTVTFEPAFTTKTKTKTKTKSSSSSTKTRTWSKPQPTHVSSSGSGTFGGSLGGGSGTVTAALAGSSVTIDKRDASKPKSSHKSSSSSSTRRKPTKTAAAAAKATFGTSSGGNTITGTLGGSSTTVNSGSNTNTGSIIFDKRQLEVSSEISSSSGITFSPASGSKPKHSKTQISGSTFGTIQNKRQDDVENALSSTTLTFSSAEDGASTTTKSQDDAQFYGTLIERQVDQTLGSPSTSGSFDPASQGSSSSSTSSVSFDKRGGPTKEELSISSSTTTIELANGQTKKIPTTISQ